MDACASWPGRADMWGAVKVPPPIPERVCGECSQLIMSDDSFHRDGHQYVHAHCPQRELNNVD